ncbi:MAG TPA: IS1634 family transposase, partial [Ktedonobacterales bacterium]
VGERWLVVRTTQGEQHVRATLSRQVGKTRHEWELALWHLGNQRFACEPDARTALARQLKQRPEWLTVQTQLVVHPKHRRPGRPPQHATLDRAEWQITATVTVDEEAVTREAQRKAAFVVATNVLDLARLSDQELIQTYKEQHSVERGFSFLKDPLFLASSVFVKKPQRLVALNLVMVLCLLVYRLAEHRLRQQLVATGQTIPDQLKKPTSRPTMRWVFQCFEGIELLHIRHGPNRMQSVVLRLEPLHVQILTLLGPSYRQLYQSHNQPGEP